MTIHKVEAALRKAGFIVSVGGKSPRRYWLI